MNCNRIEIKITKGSAQFRSDVFRSSCYAFSSSVFVILQLIKVYHEQPSQAFK